MELDRVPLWRGDHVAVKQLAEDFARYLYLPRLKDPAVLVGAVQDGLGLLLWATETFAYADSFDEAERRYRGLRCGQQSGGSLSMAGGLLVRPEVALRQLASEAVPVPGSHERRSGHRSRRPGSREWLGGDQPSQRRPPARLPKALPRDRDARPDARRARRRAHRRRGDRASRRAGRAPRSP